MGPQLETAETRHQKYMAHSRAQHEANLMYDIALARGLGAELASAAYHNTYVQVAANLGAPIPCNCGRCGKVTP